MTEPRRLSLESDSDLERLLLRSGRNRAPMAARNRALVAATATLAATCLAAGSAAAGSAAAKTGSAAMIKSLGIAGVVGLGAITAAAVIGGGHATTTQTAQLTEETVTVATVAPPVQVGAAPAVAPSAPPEPSAPRIGFAPPSAVAPQAATGGVPSRPIAVAKAAPAASVGSSVPAELATLERARAAAASGNPAGALAILDDYAMRFPHASMASEATVLRIEALVAGGDRPGAQRVAGAFLAVNPGSPYAARIRSLVGDIP